MRHKVMVLALVLGMASMSHAQGAAKAMDSASSRTKRDASPRTQDPEKVHKQVTGELLRVSEDLFWVFIEKEPARDGKPAQGETFKFLAKSDALVKQLKSLEVFDEIRVDYTDVGNTEGKLAHSITKVE
ncbi:MULTISPECIES: hypothetical protein [unclassified Corallococcus]|uniref:hypothetical protein n=1 Tax=unclassified Corallococcus TaxID=2685029 RepID=UPI001A8D3CE4|nr:MULTISPECIES: hypothetical protein [unclassified Corallococcus]MBN9685172.1 hypothetical protein [Corallococcus sp. NCSPR001]WAS83370.1 hypothetical protein O0N60_29155 [Corallococcus sp. NCRR]